LAETVVITGASRGIGLSCAELFAAKGYTVVGSFLNTEIKSDKIDFYKADMSSESDIKKFSEYVKKNYGGADILINNAGVALQKLITDTTETDVERIMSVNAKAYFLTSKAFLPHMIHQKRGAIVNISSIWGITGASCEALYSMSKAAVIGLTKALAKEVGPSGIRVNAVAPGVIDTDMNSNLSAADKKEIIENTPLLRIGTPSDIAEAVHFLASEKASFITGQVLTVDGGYIS
jgi:3-oxoacyl-[acyl-carrier protein] reductase